MRLSLSTHSSRSKNSLHSSHSHKQSIRSSKKSLDMEAVLAENSEESSSVRSLPIISDTD